MADTFQTILIVGATSGIGEALARQYHAKGKQVIVSGRRLERLHTLADELPGLGTVQVDIQDLSSIPMKVEEMFRAFPDIDSVIISAGIQKYFMFNNADISQDTPPTDSISTEITTNLSGPIVFARSVIPHLLKARPDKPYSLAFVTSGLAYVPVPMFPIYCATKSALHYFAVSLRAQLKNTPISVVEIVPPYVDTALDHEHRDAVIELFGGEGKVPKGMPVGQYAESVVKGLEEKDEDGKVQKVIADGFPKKAADAWVETYRPMMKMFGVDV